MFKNTGKRVLAFALALYFMGSAVPARAFATGGTEGGAPEEPPLTSSAPELTPSPEPTATPAPEEQAVKAVFSVSWDPAPHSGTPDISALLAVYPEEGEEPVAGALIEPSADKVNEYLVTGLPDDSTLSYRVKLLNEELCSMSPAEFKLVYSKEELSYLPAEALVPTLSPKTFDFYFTFDMPAEAGALLPESSLQLGEETLPLSPVKTESGLFVYAPLYKLDGEYTLTLGKLPGFAPVSGSYELGGIDASSGSETSPLQIPWQTVNRDAVFSVYWDDMNDLTGSRPQLDGAVQVYLINGENETLLENVTVTAAEPVATEHGERIDFSISGLPYAVAEGCQLAVRLAETDFSAYENSENESLLVSPLDGQLLLSLADGQEIYSSNAVFAAYLPRWELEIAVEGLDEANLADFFDKVELSEAPYAVISVEGNTMTIGGLPAADKGQPLSYTVTWPGQLGFYALSDEQPLSVTVPAEVAEETVSRVELSFKELAELSYSEGKGSQTGLLWHELPDNVYDHGGQLEMSLPLSVNGGKPIEIVFTPESWTDLGEGSYAYTHKLSAAELKALGLDYSDTLLELIASELAPVTVTDSGSTDLQRTLTAAVQKVSGTGIDGTKYNLEFSCGSITVNKVHFLNEGANIQSYVPGTSVQNGETLQTMYPMTEVDFSFSVRSGEDDAMSVIALAGEYINLIIKNKDGSVVEAPLSEDISYFEKTFGIEMDADNCWKRNEDESYTVLLPLYDSNKLNLDYAFCADSTSIPLNDGSGDYYRVSYSNSNVPGHGTHTDMAYDGGRISLIKTGVTDFDFTLAWADAAEDEKRPDPSFTLWRYSVRDDSSFTAAAICHIPVAGTDKELESIRASSGTDNGDGTVSISIPKELPKYDSDGYPYVYFVRQSALPSNYNRVFGYVSGSESGGDLSITDTLPEGYPGTERLPSDNSIYPGGTITNRLTETVSFSSTKKWNAAAYQDSLQNFTVGFRLMAKHATELNDPDCSDEAFVMAEKQLDSFSAFNSSADFSLSGNYYDAHGHKLTLWLEESFVIDNGETVNVNLSTENYDADNPPSADYTLPSNLSAMENDGYSEGCSEHFVATVEKTKDGYTFTNSVVGTTEYWLMKSWRGLKVRDINIQLYLIDSTGALQPYQRDGEDVVFTLKADDAHYSTSANGLVSTGWFVPEEFANLEKYDEDGNLCTYMAIEQSSTNYHGNHTYAIDVDGDGKPEKNSVQILNMTGGSYRDIDVRKVWLDDSAGTDRATVYLNIYAQPDGEEPFLIYGSENGKTGVLSSSPIALSADTDWYSHVVVTIFRTDDGEYVSEKDAHIESMAWAESHLYTGLIYVKEAFVGTSPVDSSEAGLTQAGYSTVSYGNTKYAVIYSGDKPSEYATANSDGVYVISNLRIGTSTISINKSWYEDPSVNRQDFTSTFTVTCTDDPTRIFSEDGKGYSVVSRVVNEDGRMAILGSDSNGNRVQVDATQTVDSGKDTSTVYFYELPLYDETGRILHYSISEDITHNGNPKPAGNYKKIISAPEHDFSEDGTVDYSYDVSNLYANNTEVFFDLLWLDDTRVINKLRPDMYLTLYASHYVYDDNGEIVYDENNQPKRVIERYGYKEYSWEGKEVQKRTEDWWRFSFSSMPEYDSRGHKIEYFATINSYVDGASLNYIDPQYAVLPNKNATVYAYNEYLENTISTVTRTGGYLVSHDTDSPIAGVIAATGEVALRSGNVFVLQLKDDISVKGRKVWKNLPEYFPLNDLPLLDFTLTRKTPENGAADALTELSSADDSGEGICIAAAIGIKTTSLEFGFLMNYIGLNDAEGELIPADTPLTYGEHSITALRLWMELAEIDSSKEAEARAIYGTYLPRYDGKGKPYEYILSEEVAGRDIIPGIDVIYERLENTIVGYNITNTYKTDFDNSRDIAVFKEFYTNDTLCTTDESFLAPDMEFELWRTCLINNSGTYNALELVATGTLTAEMAKAGEPLMFNEQLIYAPNGNLYVYYVCEAAVKGYNTDPADPAIVVSGQTLAVNDILLPVPGTADKDIWHSAAFSLVPYSLMPDNEPSKLLPLGLEEAAILEFTNRYTACEQAEITVTKVWEDYANAFLTRPETLVLELYRKTDTVSEEHVGTITLSLDSESDTVGAAFEFDSETPYISGSAAGNSISVSAEGSSVSDNWTLKIENLDGYASTGEAWRYTLKEEFVPLPYRRSGDASIGNNYTIKNDIYTSLAAEKVWQDVNLAIEMPDVTVALQVSTDGENWFYTEDKFSTVAGLSDYEHSKTFNSPDSWKTLFVGLPLGEGGGEDFVPYLYRAIETAIADQTVNYNSTDTTAAPVGSINSGDAEYTATSSGGTVTDKLSTVTNSITLADFTVTKQWLDDSNNAFGSRNGNWSVDFHLYRSTDGSTDNGKPVCRSDRKTPYVITVSSDDSNDTAATPVSGLSAYAPDGSLYTYYAVELDVDGQEVAPLTATDINPRYNGSYEVTYSHSGSGYSYASTVTNRLILTELRIGKLWNDAGTSIRPETIELLLYRNDTDISEDFTAAGTGFEWNTQLNPWGTVFINLPKFDEDGKEYSYTIAEKQQQTGYTKADYPTVGEDSDYDTVIENNLTRIKLDKLSSDGKQSLNGVTLVFTSTAAITDTLHGGESFFRLRWSRDLDKNESWTIYYGSSAESCTNVWTSGTGEVLGLPEGSYKLTAEEDIPSGYYASAVGAGFTLSNANGKQTLRSTSNAYISCTGETATAVATVTVKNQPTVLKLQKLDENGNVISEGWQFKVEPVEGASFSDGSTEARFFDPGEVWTGGLNANTVYALTETLNPAGYVLSDAVVYFIINGANNCPVVTDINGTALSAEAALPGSVNTNSKTLCFADAPFSITLTKLSTDGAALPDAEFDLYELTDAGESLIRTADTIVTAGENGTVTVNSNDLRADGSCLFSTGHSYKLVESKAPDGYILTNPAPWISFSFDEAGNAVDITTGGTATEDFVFTNSPIALSLVKYDGGDEFITEEVLPDVYFSLYEGFKLIGKVSTDENGSISFGPDGDLSVKYGVQYRLVEDRALGFEQLSELSFSIDPTGYIVPRGELPAGWSFTDESYTQLKAVNTRKTGTVTLTKVDSMSMAELNNVYFELYKLDEETESWLSRFFGVETGKSYTLLESFSWKNDSDDSIKPGEAAKGVITISGLDWGSYKLVERSSDGYVLTEDEDDRSFGFTIDRNNVEAVISVSNHSSGKLTNTPNRVSVLKVDADNEDSVLSGAIYELYYTADAEGNSIDRLIPNNTDKAQWVWNSEEGRGEASHLSPGTYTLVETQPPVGYSFAEDLVFTIDEFGRVDGKEYEELPIVLAKDEKTRFSFTKMRLYNESCSRQADALLPLEGAVFTAYSDAACTQELMSAESAADGKVEFVGLPLGTVYFRETATAAGHVLDTRVFTAVINSEGDAKLSLNGQALENNTLVNDVFRADFSFIKVSELDNSRVIEGAVYGLYAGDELIAQATSAEDGAVSFTGLLMDKEYTVRELSTPTGSYVSANPISFRFSCDENGEISRTLLSDGDGTVIDGDNGLLWLEPQVIVHIIKVNEVLKPMKGAELQLQDKKGNIIPVWDSGILVESWVSDGGTKVLTSYLEAGRTYYLHELKAPEGYSLAKPVEFTVSDEPVEPGAELILEVVMINKPIRVNPHTGDEAELGAWLTAALGFSFMTVCALFRFKGRKRRTGRHEA